MGTCWNRLAEAVLTCTHNQCFEQKYEKNIKFYPVEFSIFSSGKKSLSIAWAYFRNVVKRDCRHADTLIDLITLILTGRITALKL